jgi:hypothetical protein
MKSASRWFHCTDILWCTVKITLSLYYVLKMGPPYKGLTQYLYANRPPWRLSSRDSEPLLISVSSRWKWVTNFTLPPHPLRFIHRTQRPTYPKARPFDGTNCVSRCFERKISCSYLRQKTFHPFSRPQHIHYTGYDALALIYSYICTLKILIVKCWSFWSCISTVTSLVV